jgi:hypothetical protein
LVKGRLENNGNEKGFMITFGGSRNKATSGLGQVYFNFTFYIVEAGRG